ncbi:phage tail protein [Streptomyces sp. NPDC005533]|uniref:phage tail protein n=1 Tax=Streptomyces sp. NPDC005533 TaxID=3364723 RepID=UPI0036A8CE5C
MAIRTHTFTVEFGSTHVETVQSATGLHITDALSGEQPSALPGEITIIRGIDQSTAFTDWLRQGFKFHKQNITIVITDTTKKDQKRVNLTSAWVSSWSSPAQGSTSTSAAAETLTLTYDSASVE